MSGGLYKLLSGPSLDYTYTYDEFKLITNGVFHLTDSDGKKVAANEGDLVYFPKNTFVSFTSPHWGLGFYVGQRPADTA